MFKKLITLTLILLFLASTASATTLTVPTQYRTIQKAVNAASDGDTIQVSAGTYNEYVNVTGKHLNLYGRTQGGSSSYYPKVKGIELQIGGGGVVNGFNFTGNGIKAHDTGGENLIRNNYFTNCKADIWTEVCSDNTIMNNQFSGYNSGIEVTNSWNNIVMGNTFSKAKVGLLVGDGGDVNATKNTFKYCQTAVLIYPGGAAYLNYNTYTGNTVKIKRL